MDATPVIQAKAVALAASVNRLYIAGPHKLECFDRNDFELERTLKAAVQHIVHIPSADSVAVIEKSRACIYSGDLRKQTHVFDSGSAACLAASESTVVVASKRRIRWATWSNNRWNEDQLAIPGVQSLTIHQNVLYAVSNGQVLAIDLQKRVVRELPMRIPQKWGSPKFHVAFSKSLVVVAGSNGWINSDTFELAEAPVNIASLGELWAAAGDAHIDIYYNKTLISRLDISARIIADGFIATRTEVLRFDGELSPAFVQNLAQDKPELALSLAKNMHDPEIDKMRLEQAHLALSRQQWNKAITYFSDASAKPQIVVPAFEKILGDLEKSSPVSSAPSSSAASISSRASTRDRILIPEVEAFLPYLTAERRTIKIKLAAGELDNKEADEQLAFVDTALFQCYYLSKSSLIGALVRNENLCDPAVVTDKLTKLGRWRELVGFLSTRSLHQEALELLAQHGTPEDSVTYMERIQSFDIIERFAPAALSSQPNLAKNLFAESSFEPHKVFQFLSAQNNPYALEYLKERVSTSKEQVLHHDLATYYLEHDIIHALNEFLETSDSYNPRVLLPKIPQKQFDTRVILYSKMGKHEKVIDLLVENNAYEQAREYCTQCWQRDRSTVALNHLYNEVSDHHPEELVPLLNSHGHLLDPKTVIEKLPLELKISDISSFFNNQSRHLVTETNFSRLRSTLSQAFLADSTYELAHLRDRHALVESTTTCAHCKRRLGLSVIVLFNGFILHYGCLDAFRSIY